MVVEVILKKRVETLGAESDVVKVKPGYARNYLIPKNLAVVATAASKKQIDHLKKMRAQREAEELSQAQEIASKLNKSTVTFQMQVSEGGRKVFGSISAQDIADRLATMGFTLDKRKINLPKSIKDSGSHEVSIDLGAGVHAKVKIVIEVPADETAEVEEDSSKRKTVKKKDFKK